MCAPLYAYRTRLSSACVSLYVLIMRDSFRHGPTTLTVFETFRLISFQRVDEDSPMGRVVYEGPGNLIRNATDIVEVVAQ